MLALIQTELFKIIKKPRSFIGFVALTIICVMLQIGFYFDGKELMKFVTDQVDSQLQLDGKILNGNLVCYIVLQMLIVQMPLLVSLVSGDIISGESASGSLRYLVAQRYSRRQIFFAKWLAGVFYTTALLIWLGVLALLLSRVIFGQGDVIAAFSDNISITRAAQADLKFLQAFGIAFIALNVVSSFSFMLSTFLDNSVAPIVIVMATIIIFTIIGTFNLPIFEAITPFLFTTHMIVWRNLFEYNMPLDTIYWSIGVMLAHIVLFTLIALYHFNKKDISS